MADPIVTALQQCIRYEPDTGLFFWVASPPKGVAIGAPVRLGSNGNGYLYANLRQGWKMGAHQLAFVLMHGRWAVEVDHKDLNRANNRWTNLREATRSQNEHHKPKKRNNTSGFKGVSWHKARNRWRATINVAGKQTSLGYYDDPGEASVAYLAAAKQFYGEFARA